MDETLYVVTAISNPRRYRTRYDLYRKFADYVEKSGAVLITVELAFGDRPFEITNTTNPNHIQVQTNDEIWHKENLINIGISRLPISWKYVAWVDADITFARPDWVTETIQMLQHHPVVQMFSSAHDLSPSFEPINRFQGFVSAYKKTGKFMPNSKDGGYGVVSHPGYAWAATHEAIDTLGGLYDAAIVGAGDHHMACALIGQADASVASGVHNNYGALVSQWGARAAKLRGDIGYVEGLVNHYWHGSKKNRQYTSRWDILINNAFDPLVDIHKDAQGVLKLAHNKPKLRDDLRKYFSSRNEDGIDE